VRLSYRLGSQVPVPDIERCGEGTCYGRHPCALRTEVVRGLGAEHSGRPCPSCGLGSAAAFDFQVDGYLERKDSDKAFQELPEPEKEALLGQPFLGAWLFCEHGRSGRGHDPTICCIPGKGRT